MKLKYSFLPRLIIRTPAYDYGGYKLLSHFFNNQESFITLAISLANPNYFTFKKKSISKSISQKEIVRLNKYLNRLTFRPTPFGAFASFTVSSWGDKRSVELVKLYEAHLHLNLDQQVALQLGKILMLELDQLEIPYCVNPSLYTIGNEYRFLNTTQVSGHTKLLFELESYQRDKLIDRVLKYGAQDNLTGATIINLVMDTVQCSPEMAQEYFNFLTDAQLLVPLWRPNLAGTDYLAALIDNAGVKESALKGRLRSLLDRMKQMTTADLNKLSDLRRDIGKHLEREPSGENYFYAGLERRMVSGSLDVKYQQQLTGALEALRVLSLPARPGRLVNFIRQFEATFERRKVPLLVALDPENGISYSGGTEQVDGDELRHQVAFHRPSSETITLQWSAVHRLLLSKWNTLGHGNDNVIRITTDDIAALYHMADSLRPTPASIPLMFRLLDDQLLIESAGGISATALIGRFTLWSRQVHQISTEIAGLEQAANPDVIFAELGQLSDVHADNINRRLHVYPYEIVINAGSILPQQQQLPLSDLLISVVNGQLILESRRLSRRIIPRLSSAYNYNRNDFAPFQLLCDLQYQGVQSSFNLDMEQYFPGMGHYPRVMLGDTILYSATWTLSANDVVQLTSVDADAALQLFAQYRHHRKWPAMVALKRHDQYLVFDLNRNEEVHFLLDCLKGTGSAVLQEFLLPKEPVVTAEGKGLVDQFIALVYRRDTIYHAVPTSREDKGFNKSRNYMPGSKWLYLKLYCQPSASNELLASKLFPLLKKIQDGQVIQWFFVRYRDDQYHIRLRIKITEKDIGPVLSLFKKIFSKDVGQHLIREYQADTYRRELERYGKDLITDVEDFFHRSSSLILSYIRLWHRRSVVFNYYNFAFVSIRDLLDIWMPELIDQVTYCEKMSVTFQSEFAGDRSLRIDLDRKFRDVRSEMDQILSGKDVYVQLRLLTEKQAFIEVALTLHQKMRKFQTDRRVQLIADLIHMHLNRLFVDDQRQQELVVYHCLYKYLLSKLVRQRSG